MLMFVSMGSSDTNESLGGGMFLQLSLDSEFEARA